MIQEQKTGREKKLPCHECEYGIQDFNVFQCSISKKDGYENCIHRKYFCPLCNTRYEEAGICEKDSHLLLGVEF
jgi:hypothetical protein